MFRARVPVLVQPPLPLHTLQVMDRLCTFPNLHGLSFLLWHAEAESGSNCPTKTKKDSFSQTFGRQTGYKGVSFHHPRRVLGVCSCFHFWATLSTRSRRTALVGTYRPTVVSLARFKSISIHVLHLIFRSTKKVSARVSRADWEGSRGSTTLTPRPLPRNSGHLNSTHL